MYLGYPGVNKYVSPKGVKIIAEEAFGHLAYDLREIVLRNDVTLIERHAFYSCDQLISIIIGENVKQIENYAFNDCDSLEKIYCEAPTKPAEWGEEIYIWSPKVEIVWNYQE